MIISTVGECEDIRKILSPTIKPETGSRLILHRLFPAMKPNWEGSSFAQILNKIGNETPDIKNEHYFASAFETVQELIRKGKVLAGHDIFIRRAGHYPFGNVVSPMKNTGLTIHLENLREKDPVKSFVCRKRQGWLLFKVSILIGSCKNYLKEKGIAYYAIASIQLSARVENPAIRKLDLPTLRDTCTFFFFAGSATIRKKLAGERFDYYKKATLRNTFPENWQGTYSLGAWTRLEKTQPAQGSHHQGKGVDGDGKWLMPSGWPGFGMSKGSAHTDLITGRRKPARCQHDRVCWRIFQF